MIGEHRNEESDNEQFHKPATEMRGAYDGNINQPIKASNELRLK